MNPEERILTKEAKAEIQRAWEQWEGNKDESTAIDEFYMWLLWNRPSLLTFKGTCKRRLQVKYWVIEYEDEQGQSPSLDPSPST